MFTFLLYIFVTVLFMEQIVFWYAIYRQTFWKFRLGNSINSILCLNGYGNWKQKREENQLKRSKQNVNFLFFQWMGPYRICHLNWRKICSLLAKLERYRCQYMKIRLILIKNRLKLQNSATKKLKSNAQSNISHLTHNHPKKLRKSRAKKNHLQIREWLIHSR